MYENGKIYRIVCNTTGLQYIGSTTVTLRRRLSGHKDKFKAWKEGKTHNNTSFKVLENNFPCATKDQLHARERYWIETLTCVNKQRPTRTDQEYYKDNQCKIKEYREANKDRILTYAKSYREAHKETILAKNKAWREAHKEEVLSQKKDYYVTKREEILKKQAEQFACECGSVVRKNDLARHKRTSKHQIWLTLSQCQEDLL
jgi:hypothetical protein